VAGGVGGGRWGGDGELALTGKRANDNVNGVGHPPRLGSGTSPAPTGAVIALGHGLHIFWAPPGPAIHHACSPRLPQTFQRRKNSGEPRRDPPRHSCS